MPADGVPRLPTIGEIALGDRSKRAIVYVAWGERHLAEAMRGAESAAIVGVDRLLITNSESRKWLRANAPFERIVEHEFLLSGQLAKTEMFALLPQAYDSFVFLDTDTIILLDIDQGFEKAERHGMALAPAASYALEHFWGFGKVLADAGIPSREILLYNSGVIFFTRQPGAWEVLALWRALCATAVGDVSAWGDQPYLTMAMELLNFNPYTLSIAYNYRNLGELACGLIRIWHSHSPPPEDLNVFGQPWPARRYLHGRRLQD